MAPHPLLSARSGQFGQRLASFYCCVTNCNEFVWTNGYPADCCVFVRLLMVDFRLYKRYQLTGFCLVLCRPTIVTSASKKMKRSHPSASGPDALSRGLV